MTNSARWFVLPCLPLLLALLLARFEWFASNWVVGVFAIGSFLLLIAWRRATFRLEPSLRTLEQANIDARTKRVLTRLFVAIFAVSVAIHVFALICLIVLPTPGARSGFVLAFGAMAWASVVKFGACNVIAHHVLVHVSPGTDFPRNPLHGSRST